MTDGKIVYVNCVKDGRSVAYRMTPLGEWMLENGVIKTKDLKKFIPDNLPLYILHDFIAQGVL